MDTAVFVDGDYLAAAALHLPKGKADLARLDQALRDAFGADTFVFVYRTAWRKSDDRDLAAFAGKRLFPVSIPVQGHKTSIDARLFADLAAEAPHFGRVVLVTGDSDAIYPLSAQTEAGVATVLVAPSPVSPAFRAATREFIDLAALLAGEVPPQPPPARDDPRLATRYLRADRHVDHRASVRSLVAAATRRVFYVDRYIDAGVVDLLCSAPGSAAITLFTDRRKSPDLPDLIAARRATGRAIEAFQVGHEFHDRLLVANDAWWHFGHSLKNLGEADSFINRLKSRPLIAELEDRLAAFQGTRRRL